MSDTDKSKAVVMKAPSGPLSASRVGRRKKPVKTALDEDEFTEVENIFLSELDLEYHIKNIFVGSVIIVTI